MVDKHFYGRPIHKDVKFDRVIWITRPGGELVRKEGILEVPGPPTIDKDLPLRPIVAHGDLFPRLIEDVDIQPLLELVRNGRGRHRRLKLETGVAAGWDHERVGVKGGGA